MNADLGRQLCLVVMSRKEAVKLQYRNPDGTPSAMISIASVGGRYSNSPKPVKDVRSVLYVNFDDVVDDADGYYPCTENDARKVVDFVTSCVELRGLRRLYVHCDAGLSRSAAIAKAVQEHYRVPDGNVSYKEGSTPNPLVYRLMTDAFDKFMK